MGTPKQRAMLKVVKNYLEEALSYDYVGGEARCCIEKAICVVDRRLSGDVSLHEELAEIINENPTDF